MHPAFEKHHTHNGIIDQDQMNVIFNPSRRLIIEAPAGYGKTKTMVSKIAYLIETNQLPSTKKILALTFSVNASFKIKREILELIGSLLEGKTAIRLINQRVETSNYHGFGRHVLTLYGYLIHPNLVHVNHFKVIDETSKSDLRDLQLKDDDKDFLESYAGSLKAIGKPGVDAANVARYLDANREKYINILLEKFVPNNYFTYNGILLFTLALFNDYPQAASFYQAYYPIMFVDEFQDTNWLQWKILSALTGGRRLPSTIRHLYLFGDRVQRIYGFIGAVPNIFDIAKGVYQMDLIKLNTNHRFATDSKLGKIDRVLRANAENIRNPEMPFSVKIPIIENSTQAETSKNVLARTQEILDTDSSSTVAILVRTGLSNTTTKEIYTALRAAKIPFFFALYKEDDQDYIDFHKKCSDIWLCGIQKGFRSFKSAQSFMSQEVALFPSTEVNYSLTVLLKLLLDKVQKEYTFLSFEEKAGMIIDTLTNRGLKQHLDLVTDSRVILATVHGAKGLEWDYVIMPDVQKFCFPPAPFCINNCVNCNIDWTKRSTEFEQAILDELSVFYVAVTRARKDVIFLFSNTITFNSGKTQNSPLSCLAKLPGLIRVE
ncbi:MAG: UvrD-helicase domain-containing protein [Bellilinea sp.]